MIPDPPVTEDSNDNPDEVTDDGLGTPEPPEVITDHDVDEDEGPASVTVTGDSLVVTEDDGEA